MLSDCTLLGTLLSFSPDGQVKSWLKEKPPSRIHTNGFFQGEIAFEYVGYDPFEEACYTDFTALWDLKKDSYQLYDGCSSDRRELTFWNFFTAFQLTQNPHECYEPNPELLLRLINFVVETGD